MIQKYSILNLLREYNKNKVAIDNYLNNNIVENYTSSSTSTYSRTENNGTVRTKHYHNSSSDEDDENEYDENEDDENEDDENEDDENEDDENEDINSSIQINSTNSASILGFGIGTFLIFFLVMFVIFLYTIYLIFSSDLHVGYKIILTLILLFSGPLTNIISFFTVVFLKNRDIKKCLALNKNTSV